MAGTADAAADVRDRVNQRKLLAIDTDIDDELIERGITAVFTVEQI